MREFDGELHVHSTHSDGKLPVRDVSEHLRANGYDFFFLTDHNSIRGWNDFDKIEGIKIYRGLELTAFDGHILLLGVNDYMRWYGDDGNIRPFESIYREAKLKHGLMGIAHPYCAGGMFCAGCRWNYEIDPDHMDFVEVWNSKGHNWRVNWESVELWLDLLKQGRKILATSGADFHLAGDLEPSLRTRVLSPTNTESHIMNSLKLGRYYLSAEPRINLEISGKTFGETIITEDLLNLQYSVKTAEAEDLSICMITKRGLRFLNNLEDNVVMDFLEDKDFIVLMRLTRERKLKFLTNPVFTETL